MKIFVTGFHRAGTHSAAEHFAKKHGLLYFEESRIRWDSLEAAELLASGYLPKWNRDKDGILRLKGYKDPMLKKGFVLQCPGLAHKTLELAKLGKVFWCTRNRLDTITAMKNAQINVMAWDIMREFFREFPDDPIWTKLEGVYRGKEDRHYGFTRYKALLCSVKDYFYQKYFKAVCEKITVESMPYYKGLGGTLTGKKPLKDHEEARIIKDVEEYERICVDKA